MRLRVLSVVALLLVSGSGFAFIMKMFPLKDVLDASTNVLVGRIESIDRGKKTAVAVIDRALKGKREFKRVRMNLGVGTRGHGKYLLDRLRVGEPVVVMYQRKGKEIACCVHSADTWFQLFATDKSNRDKVWWRFTHLEIYMGRTYNGTTADFAKLVEGVLSGRVKSPKPNPKVPKLNLSAKRKPKPRPVRRDVPAVGKRTASKPRRAGVVGGLEELKGWGIETAWSRPGKISLRKSGRGKLMEIACEGEADKKLALSLMHKVDAAGANRIDLDVRNATSVPVKVSVGLCSAPNFDLYETPQVTVPPSKTIRRVSFRIDRKNFKCRTSDWKHTQSLPGRTGIGKVMILVEGLPKKGRVSFDNMRFVGGGFRKSAEFRHKGGEARGIAWADVNGDGTMDAIVCATKGNLLLVNQGDGEFVEQSSAFGLRVGSRAASWADYNGDGHPDLVTHDFRLFTNVNGRLRDDSKLLRAPRGRNPEGAGWIDYNGDGRPDILYTNGQYGIFLFENTGKGPNWFRDVSGKAGLGRKGAGVGNGDFVVFSDLDSDGLTDVFYNVVKGLAILNDGEGKFTVDGSLGIQLSRNSSNANSVKGGVSLADYDRDGDLDVFVFGKSGARLYRNNNDGTFSDVTKSSGDLADDRSECFSAAWGDLDGDGMQDLLVCRPKGGSRLYLGDGSGKFRDVTSRMVPSGLPSAYAASFADVDGDGDLDLMMNTSDRAVLYINELGVADDRSALLVSIKSVKGATGAVVRVLDERDRPVGIREFTGAESCGGQSSPVGHFTAGRGDVVKVSACLSDGRVARKTVVLKGRLVLLRFTEANFK